MVGLFNLRLCGVSRSRVRAAFCCSPQAGMATSGGICHSPVEMVSDILLNLQFMFFIGYLKTVKSKESSNQPAQTPPPPKPKREHNRHNIES